MLNKLNRIPLNIQLFAEGDEDPQITSDEMLAQLGDPDAAARIAAQQAAAAAAVGGDGAGDGADTGDGAGAANPEGGADGADGVDGADDPAAAQGGTGGPKDPKKTPAAKPNPMKEVRDQLNAEKAIREKTTKAIQRLADGDYDFKLKDFKNEEGVVDYDLLISSMDEVDVKAEAQSKGISPEVQAEINRIEKEKVELQKQQLQVQMDRALITLQQEMGVKSDQINTFFADAMAKKYNPYMWLAQGGNLQDLYVTVYRDQLLKRETDKAVAAARAVWEADARKTTNVPAANPAAPAKPQAQVAKDGIDFNSMLDAVVKK